MNSPRLNFVRMGLSEAIPPGNANMSTFQPRRGDSHVATGSGLLPEQASVNTRILVPDKVHSAATTPSGVESPAPTYSGGVAALNRRLMALTPHGVDVRSHRIPSAVRL